MGTNGTRPHGHDSAGPAGRAAGDGDDLQTAVLVVAVVQDPAEGDLAPTEVAPEGWMASWASRFDPSAADAGEDLAVAWDPERVAQVGITLRPLTADQEAALAATGWQRLSVDGHEVWVRSPEAAHREIESRRRHPSSRPAGIEI